MKKLLLLTCAAFLAFALMGCETTPTTSNSDNAVVTNDNTEMNTNTNMNANETADADGDWDWDMTRDDYDKDKDKYETRRKEDYEDDSIGSGANDSWLWFKTRAALATTDDLRDSTINVDVENEVVTLKGTVGTAAQKAAAEKSAKDIDGVKSVTNELKVAPNDSMTNTASDDDDDEDNTNTNMNK